MSLTPMLKQYQAIRQKLAHDTILFFRLGDFYEMFFDDAKTASPLLDITLTARDGGSAAKVPMCGIPYHAAQGYINRLTRAGLKVAICEQVEDPQLARGIVKREVTRIVSPATNLEDDFEEKSQCAYIAALCQHKGCWGCACLDLGTGDFRVGDFSDAKTLEDELLRLAPRELVLPEAMDRTTVRLLFREQLPAVTTYDDWIFDPDQAGQLIRQQFKVASLAGFGIADLNAGIACAGALLYYLRDNLYTSLEHLRRPIAFQSTHFMNLDKQTARNLEIMKPPAEGRGSLTLCSILNMTCTPMGARLLTQWLTRPLLNCDLIRQRLDAVDELVANQGQLHRLQQALKPVRDLERLVARLNCGSPSARDIVALGVSLQAVPEIKQALTSHAAPLFVEQQGGLCELTELTATVMRALVDCPPLGVREGGFVRSGYSAELDELRSISTSAREWIASLQQQEAERTGIRSLKIRYNKVFGYYIEVTKPNLSMVPGHYLRKQTLVNAERFTIPELREYEEKILGAEQRAQDLEYQIFEELRGLVLQHIPDIQTTAAAIAVLDVLASFAAAALAYNYSKPDVSSSPLIYIAGGRHPIVERTLEGEQFVDNDVLLDNEENQLLIITGPNMAGKSTFIRQVALMALMAQAGSFVPARIARLGIVDRIFSRIGAADNLARGESTFMVEMLETASILHNATSQSLLVFDEIGRGTSTFDGVSIAWSVCEYLNRERFSPKCLFATHYHELTELAAHRRGIKNYNVTVKEIDDDILFLRKVVPGGADRSYGIHVAKLAGLPSAIIQRAGEILLCLEEEKISEESVSAILNRKRATASVYDLPLFKAARAPAPAPPDMRRDEHQTPPEHPVLKALKTLEVDRLTPLDALLKIAQWKKEADGTA